VAAIVALRAHALTSLQRVLDELALDSDGGTQDSLLTGYINSASGFIARQCGRTFQRADDIEEAIAGMGGTRLRVARAPIIDVTTVTVAGLILDDYSIDDAEAGVLYRQAGWPWCSAVGAGLDTEGIPGEEKRNVEVVYSGGYVTRPQSDTGGVDGDTSFVGEAITLPDELEDATIILVTTRWKGRGRDVRATTRHSDVVITYGGAPVPAEVLMLLSNFAAIPHA
jgi:hypothetical protein